MQASQLQPERLEDALNQGDTFAHEQIIDAMNMALFETSSLHLRHDATKRLSDIFGLNAEELQEAVKCLDNESADHIFRIMYKTLERDSGIVEEAIHRNTENLQKTDFLKSMLRRNENDRQTLRALSDACYLMDEIGEPQAQMSLLLNTAFELVEDDVYPERVLPSPQIDEAQRPEEKFKGRSKE